MALSSAANSGANSGVNSGAISGMNSAAEPLSSRDCYDAPAVDENANEAAAAVEEAEEEEEEEEGDVKGGRGGRAAADTSVPTTPSTPKGLGCGDSSMNTSALTSPDDHRSPEPVQDADIQRLKLSVPSLLTAFKVTQKIGEGTFSTVFKAHPLDPALSHVTVALKHIIPASKPQRTEHEVKCLKEMDGKDNVCPVLSCLRENDQIVLVMPHVPHDRFQDYMLDLDVDDVKDYVWNLMLSLRRVHSCDIIHRDVKPANFLFHRRKRTYCLVDFGLAHPVQLPPPPIIPSGGGAASSSSSSTTSSSSARRKTSPSASATASAGTSAAAAADLAASLRKSPRKVAKPESYSDSGRRAAAAAASPVKRKLVDPEDGSTTTAAESAAGIRASPRKRQSLGGGGAAGGAGAGISSSSGASAGKTLSPGKRKLSLPTLDSNVEESSRSTNKKTFSIPTPPPPPHPSLASHSSKRSSTTPSKEDSPTTTTNLTTTKNCGLGRTFKSPRRVLLQKRLADQAESSAPTSLRPRTLLLTPPNSKQQQQQQKKTPTTSAAAVAAVASRGPLRASHHLSRSSVSSSSSSSSKVTPKINKCQCLGKPTICSICTARQNQNANRAGTPGFRSPEVLLKSNEQNTAVDIWSAGVIFLSILTGRYPFFKATTDQSALAQIIALFGLENVERTAFRLGKKLVCSENCPPVDLRQMCRRLRHSALVAKYGQRRAEEKGREQVFPDSAYDLLRRMMDVDATTRITADEALRHPFLKDAKR